MQIRTGLFFEEQAQWPVPDTLIQTPYHRKYVSRDSLTVHVAVLWADKVNKEDMAHVNMKLLFKPSHIC